MKKINILIISLMFFVITGCMNNEQSIIIYSSMEEDRNQALIENIKEEFEDYDVKVQPIATGNSAAKIKNEGVDIEADIILDLETAHMESLKENFADLSNFDTSIYIDGINKSNKYLTWSKYTITLTIDKDYFEQNDLKVPKTYKDLLKSEYKNLIAMPDPKTSGTGYAFYLNMVNILGEDEAVKYFNKLKNNLREIYLLKGILE